MRALVAGKVLEITDREVGSIENNTRRWVKQIAIQTGKAQIDLVRLDPEKFKGPRPEEGQTVVLACWFSAWAGRSGAGLTVTAQEHADAALLDATLAAA